MFKKIKIKIKTFVQLKANDKNDLNYFIIFFYISFTCIVRIRKLYIILITKSEFENYFKFNENKILNFTNS